MSTSRFHHRSSPISLSDLYIWQEDDVQILRSTYWLMSIILGSLVLGGTGCTDDTSSALLDTQGLEINLEQKSSNSNQSSSKSSLGGSSQILPLSKQFLNRKRENQKVDIVVEDIVVARDVKQRRVVGASTQFPNHIGSLWSLATVQANGGAAHLETRWWHDERLVSTNPFVVSEGIRWREWSQITVQPKEIGLWKVEVFHPQQSKVLQSSHFKVVSEEESSLNQDQLKNHLDLETSHTSHHATTQLASLDSHQSSSVQTDHHNLLKINRLEIARSIKHRRPRGVARRFQVEDERLWGYVEVSNLEQPSHVWMEWRLGDEVRSKLKIRVGVSRSWRTWSWQRLNQRDVGHWEVRVISVTGETLAQTHFILDP